MGDGHLRKSAHEEERDDRADQVADDDAGSGDADRERAAEEQAGADGSADRDHAELAGGELTRELLALFDASG